MAIGATAEEEAAARQHGEGAAAGGPATGAAGAASIAPRRAHTVVPAVVKQLVKHELSREQQLYYASITEALAGGDPAVCEPALVSLRADPGLHPLLPCVAARPPSLPLPSSMHGGLTPSHRYFTQFFVQQVTENLRKVGVLGALIRGIDALLANPNLFAEPYVRAGAPCCLCSPPSPARLSVPW